MSCPRRRRPGVAAAPPRTGRRAGRRSVHGGSPEPPARRSRRSRGRPSPPPPADRGRGASGPFRRHRARSEEHPSELQSHSDLVCRLLLEKKKKHKINKMFFKKQTYKTNKK